MAQGLRRLSWEMTARVRAIRGSGVRAARRAAVRDAELFEQLVHDLRNPLGVIVYFAEAVPSAAAGERDELCERLRVNAQRALHVLEEFCLLADLRAGRSNPVLEVCAPGQLIEELAAEIESMERRPGLIRRQVEVRTALRLPRSHLARTLRALLRATVHTLAADQALRFSVREEGGQLRFELSVDERRDPELGVALGLPTSGIEIELAERLGALYGGGCTIEQRAGTSVITLALTPAGC